MEKQTLENILAKFEEIRERKEIIDSANREYWEAISPDNHTPFTIFNELS